MKLGNMTTHECKWVLQNNLLFEFYFFFLLKKSVSHVTFSHETKMSDKLQTSEARCTSEEAADSYFITTKFEYLTSLTKQERRCDLCSYIVRVRHGQSQMKMMIKVLAEDTRVLHQRNLCCFKEETNDVSVKNYFHISLTISLQ